MAEIDFERRLERLFADSPEEVTLFLMERHIPFETADIRAVRRFTQRLPQPSARIYVGPGKLQEIADFCREEEIDVVIFDDELMTSLGSRSKMLPPPGLVARMFDAGRAAAQGFVDGSLADLGERDTVDLPALYG